MIKLVIVEDEVQLRETNRLLLKNNFPDIKIVGEAGSVKKAIDIIQKNKPDIVLLDIELSDGNCFQILQACKPISFKPIFITAYNQFAIKAIKFSALDYILKPINEFEFYNAIDTAIKAINHDDLIIQTNTLQEQYAGTNTNKRIVLKTNDSIHLLETDDIMFCKSDNSYTIFFHKTKKEIIVSKRLVDYIDLLEELKFIRPHQSYYVNIKHIDRIDKNDGGFIIMTNGYEIPISKRRKNFILEHFKDITSDC